VAAASGFPCGLLTFAPGSVALKPGRAQGISHPALALPRQVGSVRLDRRYAVPKRHFFLRTTTG